MATINQLKKQLETSTKRVAQYESRIKMYSERLIKALEKATKKLGFTVTVENYKELPNIGQSWDLYFSISNAIDYKAENEKDLKRELVTIESLKAGERVNYFSYIVPDGLISPEEVPEWAGLIYARVYDDRICIGFDKDDEPIFEDRKAVFLSTVKPAKRLRDRKVTPEEIEEINKKLYFRFHKQRCKLIGEKLITPFGIS